MDFWLPDWKYGNNTCGKKYSGIDNYFDVIARNHKRIHDEGDSGKVNLIIAPLFVAVISAMIFFS